MAKKAALGKGIASLIQNTPHEVKRKTLAKTLDQNLKTKTAQSSAATPAMVAVKEIKPNPKQPSNRKRKTMTL